MSTVDLPLFSSSQEDTQGKLDLTNTALVASIAHKFVVGDELPKVPYRTLLDYYVDGCFVLQFIVVISAFVVAYMERYDVLPELAKHHAGDIVIREDEMHPFPWVLNWALLALNVLLYLLLCAWVLLKVHYVQTDVDHWLNMADHINEGHGDNVTVSVIDIHTKTQPDHRWGLHFLHKKRNKKSKFLHFGSKKPVEHNKRAVTPRSGLARNAKVYTYADGAERPEEPDHD